MAPPQARKKSQGRKRIEMKLIEDETARMVTLSKRRVSLFRKATELSVLCGAQVALIVFSLGGRAYSFGHPSVKSVFDCFFNRNLVSNFPDSAHGAEDHPADLKQLKDECDQKSAELEIQKRRGKEIEAALENSVLSEERLSMLNLHQLKHLRETTERIRANVHRLLLTSPEIVSREPPSHSMGVAGSSNQEMAVSGTFKRDEQEASPTPPAWLKLNIDLNMVGNCVSASRHGRDGADAATVHPVWLKPKKVGQATVKGRQGAMLQRFLLFG